ncbi:MAG TPA: hypothetical protein VMJ10_29715 [Kofleriaceae bacterium]|nr:hypothetical protein [Kofleriaceae bacterium]
MQVSLGQGGANALLWDATASTLYYTDNTADALDKYTTGTSGSQVATLPTSTGGISLGGMLEQGDGSILIANFGFGQAGSIFDVAASASTGTNVNGGLDATRRRIGIARDSAGAMYTSYFTGGMGVQPVGGVSTLTINGTNATETEIAGATTSAGFKKVVGVAATTTAVFVSDQTQSMIFKIDLTASNAVTALATVTTADLLYMLPDGDMLTGGGATIERITQAGTVSNVTLPGNPTFSDVRGMAYDATGHRLFVVDHSTTAGVGDTLNIIPFTP